MIHYKRAMRALIVAFTYRDHINYQFDPQHVIEDVRRALTFLKGKTSVKDICILTDSKFPFACPTVHITSGQQWLDIVLHEFAKAEPLFFYLTGHGIRIISPKGKVQNVSLIIPSKNNSQGELIPSNGVQKILSYMPTETICIMDCCYSQRFCPSRLGHEQIFIGSTLKNQTCGFYSSSESFSGSLFSHALFKHLRMIHTKKQARVHLLENIEDDILSYRVGQQKAPQEIFIHTTTEYLFPWLYEKSPVLLQNEADWSP